MKFNKWTLGLAAVGVVSLTSAVQADEAKMSAVQTAFSSTTLSGYVDVAAAWRPGTDQQNGFGPHMPAYSFAKNDGFSLNAVDVALDKPMDEGLWASGYHAELMLGQDGILGTGQGVNLRQAYLTLRTPVGNGIDWKVGVFDTIIGYESNSDGLNPNYTRSYGYTIEPTTHTGVVGTYKVASFVSVTAGVANTWSESAGTYATTPATESQKTYMGAVALTAPESWGWMNGATLNAGVVHGIDSATGSQSSWFASVAIPTPVTALKFGAAFDLHQLYNSVGGTNPSNDDAWTLALYSTYQFNDKLSLNLRGDYIKDDGAFGAYGGSDAEAFTATVQYNLWANVLSRVEFRWDHVEHGTPFGSSAASPAGYKNNDFLIALNLIYQF